MVSFTNNPELKGIQFKTDTKKGNAPSHLRIWNQK